MNEFGDSLYGEGHFLGCSLYRKFRYLGSSLNEYVRYVERFVIWDGSLY